MADRGTIGARVCGGRWSAAVSAMFCALLALAFASAAAPRRAGAATACDIRYPSDSTTAWHCRRIAAGETLEGLFGARWRDVARFNRMDRRHAWPGALIRVPADLTAIENFSPMPGHYADAESSARFILIDLREQFLGAYEHGRLVLSFPIASGRAGHDTPAGDFRVDAADARHSSSKYPMEGTSIPYPMHWALRFHVSRSGVAFWIHGRDLPGVPASHGCVGLTDESMQHRYYGRPTTPEIEDARTLFAWAVGTTEIPQFRAIAPLPVRIVGVAPRPRPRPSAVARSGPAEVKLSGRRHIVEGSLPSLPRGAWFRSPPVVPAGGMGHAVARE